MSTGMLLIILLLVTISVVIYKRQMLLKMFSINVTSMADEFRTQMEATADQAVKKLENQMTQLEYMLEEADAKIIALETRLRQTEQSLSKASCAEASGSTVTLPFSVTAAQEHPLESLDSTNQKAVPAAGLAEQQPMLQMPGKLQDVVQEKRQQVLSMYHQGYNVVEIAKATAMGKGEVMLVLELNKNH